MPCLMQVCGLRCGGESAQCQVIMNFAELASVPSERPAPFTDQLRLAWLPTWPGSRLVPRAHWVRPPLLPRLVRRAWP